MFSVDKAKLNKNKKYIISIFFLLMVFVILAIVFSPNKTISKEEKDLENSGETLIHKLVINEVANNNDGSYADSENNTYDWVEIYNGTDKDINLEGYSLSDDMNKNKWFFSNTIIKAKEYLVVYLAGVNKEGLYTNFSLSKEGGETLVLKNKSGKVVDAVDTVKTNKNTSYARDLNGIFYIVKKITPGFVNTEEGYDAFIGAISAEDKNIVINEVLVRNGGQFKDDYNEYSGFIEIKNIGNEDINLKYYSLSNDINEPFKWKFPDINLEAGKVIMVYTSGRNIKDDILHTNFKLNSKTGSVILSKNGNIIQDLKYDSLANGYALSLIDGEYQKTSVLSGGYQNDNDGVDSFSKKYEKVNSTLIINEVMNSNFEYLVQNGGKYYDWIELKNNSDESINLSDYYLTTTTNDIDMYKLPNVTLKPGEYYVLMASGDENLTNNSYVHTNFKLSKTESLYLVSNEKIIDAMFIADVPTGYSYGRSDYGYVYMASPSPLKANNSGKYEVAYAPEFSLQEGIYNDVESIKVEINAPGTIYYTLNGDNPSLYSKKYTEPLILDETTVVRAISTQDGKINSSIITKSYIINENHTLPVMSLVIDKNNYNAVTSNSWSDIEKEAYITYFDGDKYFTLPCGFKMFGASTRGLPKQSFALKFRKDYGESELHYQVFENRDNSVYNSLVLRSGSQDYTASMIRDYLMTSLMEDTSVDVQAMKPVVLYINGAYWGIYFLDEKIDEDFVSSHYNVSDEDTNIVRIDGEVSAGSGKEFENLLTFMKTHDMSKDENYEYVKERINIDNLIEFWVAETFITNNDIINCRLFNNPNIDDGKWHFIFYDLDFGMYYYRVNYYTIMTDPEGMGSMLIRSTLTLNLFKNKEFKKRFVEVLSESLKNTWNEERILNKIDELHDLLLPEMERNQKRWGLTLKDWENEIENLREFAKNRKTYLLSQTKAFFNLSSLEMEEYFNDES